MIKQCILGTLVMKGLRNLLLVTEIPVITKPEVSKLLRPRSVQLVEYLPRTATSAGNLVHC